MQFAIYCLDKPDSLQLRLDTRPTHLVYLDSFEDKLVFAGPLLAEDGKSPIGSLLVFEGADAAAAKAFADGDPYAKAGLFAQVTIRPVRQVYPKA